jgi:hypothetical protein
MFENAIAYNDLVKELTIIPHITAPDDLTPGEYWVGPIEAVFPEASDDYSPYHLLLEAIGEAEAKTSRDVQGVTITWGDHKLEFLTAPVSCINRFMAHSSDEKIVSIDEKNEFSARTYIVFASMSNLRTYGKTSSDLTDGVSVSVHEPISPVTSLNLISFTSFTGQGRDTVFDVSSQ